MYINDCGLFLSPLHIYFHSSSLVNSSSNSSLNELLKKVLKMTSCKFFGKFLVLLLSSQSLMASFTTPVTPKITGVELAYKGIFLSFAP